MLTPWLDVGGCCGEVDGPGAELAQRRRGYKTAGHGGEEVGVAEEVRVVLGGGGR